MDTLDEMMQRSVMCYYAAILAHILVPVYTYLLVHTYSYVYVSRTIKGTLAIVSSAQATISYVLDVPAPVLNSGNYEVCLFQH